MSPRGWRIDRIPGKAVRRDEDDGRITVPLWLLRNGEHRADLDLTLSPAEAEVLHAQLCYALAALPLAPLEGGRMPDCRKAVQGSTGGQWP
jgi:hypothetical protein